MTNKTQAELTNKELREEVLKIPFYYLSDRTFIRIKGRDYLLKDIEKALIKGKGVKPIQ